MFLSLAASGSMTPEQTPPAVAVMAGRRGRFFFGATVAREGRSVYVAGLLSGLRAGSACRFTGSRSCIPNTLAASAPPASGATR